MSTRPIQVEQTGWGAKHETAALFIREFRQRNPDAWPSIKQVVVKAGVGVGTAHRAIRAVKSKH